MPGIAVFACNFSQNIFLFKWHLLVKQVVGLCLHNLNLFII